jgi:hypothetical protein
MKFCACGFSGVEIHFLRLDGGKGLSSDCRACQQERMGLPSCRQLAVEQRIEPPRIEPTSNQKKAAALLGVDAYELARRQLRGQKYCTGCAKWKKVYSFPRKSDQPDGRCHRCRTCMAAYHQTRKALTYSQVAG